MASVVTTENDNDDKKIAEQALEEGKVAVKDSSTMQMTQPQQQRPTSSNASARILVAAVLVAVVVALSVGLGVGLSKNGRNSNSSSSNNAAAVNQSSSTGSGGSGSSNSMPIVIEKVRIDATTRSLPLISTETLGKSYKDCGDMSIDARKMVLLMANKTIAMNLQSYYFSDDALLYPPEIAYTTSEAAPPQAMADDNAMGGAKSESSSSVTTTESSFGTNNQVDGVEEADVVLSDGSHIYTAYGGEIVKVSVASQEIVTRTTIPKKNDKCNTPSILGMLLVNDRLVVFSSGWCNEDPTAERQRVRGRRHLLSIIGPIFGTEETQFTVYSTTNLGIIGSSETLPGSYMGARAIGDDVYVVSSRYLNVYLYTNQLDPYTLTTSEMYANNTKLTQEAYEAKAWQVAEANADDFVAQLTEGIACDQMQQITLFQNSDSFHPYGPVAESIASVTSFNVNTPTVTSVSSRVMPTSYWQMYASADTLLLTAEGYYISEELATETYVLAFRLADATATPIGMGKVPGALLNQFSMDEHNGYLRFATTIRERFRYNEKTWEAISIADSDNLIVVLKVESTSGGKLEEVGRLAGLGKAGETIHSVRFLGDRAFVVTYKQIDPFYTISLVDPTKPVQVGELEIPGFSSYLHPIGANLILGVGQAVVNDQTAGLQISLFDVSNLAKPTRVANLIEAGGDGSSSDAQFDHKAFRLLENGLLILPVQVYDWSWSPPMDGTTAGAADDAKAPDDTFDGFKVYYVNQEAKTISSYYNISHGSNFYDGCWGYSYLTPRSLVFNGDVWTLKTHTILIHDLTDRVQVGDAGGINLDKDLDQDECTPYYWFDRASGFVGGPEVIMT